MSYASRNWKAVETTDLVGSKHVLTVTGDVQVDKSNETPKLEKAQPQGINPTILLLTLSVEGDSAVGGDVMLWKSVEFVTEISSHQYKQVTISGDTDDATVDVEEVLS